MIFCLFFIEINSNEQEFYVMVLFIVKGFHIDWCGRMGNESTMTPTASVWKKHK